VAVNWNFIGNFRHHGIFEPGKALLDIGTSNIYDVKKSDLLAFFREHRVTVGRDYDLFAELIAEGSGRSDDGSAKNGAWLGQVLEGIGMHYDSIDIAVGYKTRVLDLNREGLPDDMVARFDTVLNCGTTEHILNQFNAFKCIHEAVKPGGFMIHKVPMTGHTDHGYFTYTSRFFFDLAAYNKYELLDFWIDGPDGHDKMYAGPRSYIGYFPIVKGLLDSIGTHPDATAIEAMDIPNNGINVVFRKAVDSPFMGAVEMSTSWGPDGAHDVGAGVLDNYRS
jgi:hypothetical protein